MDQLIFHHKNLFTIVVIKDEVITHSDIYVPFYKYGIAFCHPNDQFCRRIGREIATGRAIKYNVIYVFDTMQDSVLDEVRHINKRRTNNRIDPYSVEVELFAHIKDIIDRKWGKARAKIGRNAYATN